jgi:hypothetical protein
VFAGERERSYEVADEDEEAVAGFFDPLVRSAGTSEICRASRSKRSKPVSGGSVGSCFVFGFVIGCVPPCLRWRRSVPDNFLAVRLSRESLLSLSQLKR